MNSRVKNYASRIDAELDKALLDKQGIPCVIVSDDVGGMRPDLMMATGGVWLIVAEHNVENALKLLKN